MTLDLDELRKVAEAATPGPWRACGEDRGGCACCLVWDGSGELVVHALPIYPDLQQSPEFSRADATHIATFDPPTVLALLDEVERLRAAAPRWIPVAERLPEEGSRVLAAARGGNGRELMYARGLWLDQDGDDDPPPNHWMPIPDPPEAT